MQISTCALSTRFSRNDPVVPRSYGDVLKFFDRKDLVDRGLVNISE
jgi:hypothetical protein